MEFVEVDDDRSAYTGKPRPGYDKLLEAVSAGAIDAIVAWDPDRLHRHPRELEDFIELVEDHGVEVATVQAGQFDLSTPAGRMHARMLGSVARFESEHRAERTRSAHEQIAAEGRWKGGRRPYGYRNVTGTGRLDVVADEAEVIREAAERVIAGERVGAIANDLNRRKVPTVTGAKWSTATLRRIVASPTVAGRRVSAGEDVGPGQWPAILEAEQVAAVRAVLERGTKRGPVPRLALLSGGRLICGACTAPMRSGRRDTGKRIYRCLNCYAQVNAEPVEQMVEDHIVHVLSTAAIPDAPELGPASESVEAIEDELAALAADLGAGRITRAEWLPARAALVARIEKARARFAATVGRASVASIAGRGAAARWGDLPLDRKQAVVDALLDSVVIARTESRGPRFDPSRVDLRWRA